MGLDMYLERCNRKAWGYKDVDIEDVKAKNPAEAKEKALERYGYEGDVVYSGAEATDVEEETK